MRALPTTIAAFIALSLLPAQASSSNSIMMTLQISGNAGEVYVPGSGEYAVSSMSNQTYTAPQNKYLASYSGGLLRSLIFSGYEFFSLKTARSQTDMHSIGLNISLDGARALVAFTRGGWNSVDNRIGDIESGKFFLYPMPTFGFGLGNIYAIKLLLGYSDIKLIGNLTLQSGRQGFSFSYNGTTSDNRQKILVTQAP